MPEARVAEKALVKANQCPREKVNIQRPRSKNIYPIHPTTITGPTTPFTTPDRRHDHQDDPRNRHSHQKQSLYSTVRIQHAVYVWKSSTEATKYSVLHATTFSMKDVGLIMSCDLMTTYPAQTAEPQECLKHYSDTWTTPADSTSREQ